MINSAADAPKVRIEFSCLPAGRHFLVCQVVAVRYGASQAPDSSKAQVTFTTWYDESMRVAIDARAFSWSGIGRYTRTLLKGLAHHREIDYLVLVTARDLAAYQHFQRASLTAQFSCQVIDGTYYSWREQTLLWWQLRRLPVDLWHFTHFNLPIFFDRPYVVTIHDITRFIFPGQRRADLAQQVAYEFVFKRAVERARGVVCVSQTTAHDLAALPVGRRGELVVIPEAVDEMFRQPASVAVRQKVRLLLGTDAPYLLFVGVWMSHKNIYRLLAAYARVRRHHPHLKLVLTGKPKWGLRRLAKHMRALGLEGSVILAGFVPHHLLPGLYAEATCFVFPSLYEGFGLPPLEAAACGVPVVASGVASIPEVMGEGAYYVNPENVESIAAGIQHVLTDSALQQRLIAAGKKRASLFREEHMTTPYHQLYQRLGEDR